MTFDLSPEQQSLAARARAIGEAAGASAVAIDEDGRIPEELRQALTDAALGDPFAGGAVEAMLVVEELAAASAGFGAAVGFGSAAGAGHAGTLIPPATPGLRGGEVGLAAIQRATGSVMARSRLVCCALAAGVGRAALSHATASMKAAGIRPTGDEVVPYWALADAATEVEAARLLTMRAAQMLERGDPAADRAIVLARSHSAVAAGRAVDAAIRVEGPGGYARGTLLERLARDARTLTVILP